MNQSKTSQVVKLSIVYVFHEAQWIALSVLLPPYLCYPMLLAKDHDIVPIPGWQCEDPEQDTELS